MYSSACWINCVCRFVVDAFASKPESGRSGPAAALNRTNVSKVKIMKQKQPETNRDPRSPAHRMRTTSPDFVRQQVVGIRLFWD